MHKYFGQCQRWLLGCVYDGCSFVITTACRVKPARSSEIVRVFRTGKPINNHANMP